MFCKNCGREIDNKAVICVGCGVAIKPVSQGKSWTVALLLSFFLGMFGAHRFYTGHNTIGVWQLVLTITIIGSLISAIWSVIDFILILLGSFKTKDGKDLYK